MVRRSPPRASHSHPVGSYRRIAISFLGITVILVALVAIMSTKRATILIETREEPKTVEGSITFVLREGQGGVPAMITSTEVVVAAAATPTGGKDVVGKSHGMVTLINKSSAPQSLIVRTRVVTDTGLVYRLDAAARVPANGKVDAAVTADAEGGAYDIGPTTFTIPGLSLARQAVVYAESARAMVGGVTRIGAISEEDVTALRAELHKQGEDVAKKVFGPVKEGGIANYFIQKEEVSSGNVVGDSVSTFTATATMQVVMVAYTKEKIDQAREQLIAKQISSDAGKLVVEAPPEVTIKECSIGEGTCRAVLHVDGVLRINPESALLQPKNFVGKTKDEVRRQVQTIPLVSWVDVSLSPSWLTTVPQFADNITVQITEPKK